MTDFSYVEHKNNLKSRIEANAKFGDFDLHKWIENKFNISVAEVDDHDLWQLATIGISCVSNDKRHTNEVLSRVINFITEGRFEVEVLDYEIEIIPVF